MSFPSPFELADELLTMDPANSHPRDLPGRYGRGVQDLERMLVSTGTDAVVAGGWAVWHHGPIPPMSSSTTYPPLKIDDSATAWIRGTRYKVIHLASEHHLHGWTAEELMRQHLDLAPEQVYAALAYFYEHKNEMIAQLKQAADSSLPLGINVLSRDALQQRLKSTKP